MKATMHALKGDLILFCSGLRTDKANLVDSLLDAVRSTQRQLAKARSTQSDVISR